MYKYRINAANARNRVLEKKAKYDEEYDRMLNEYDADKAKYTTAVRDAVNRLEQTVTNMIGDTTLNLNINVQISSYDGFEVAVNNGDRPFDSQALNWNYRCYLSSDGDVQKETGSWSGLQATTSEQINNLKESVRVLEILNNIDWKSILSTKQPEYSDYIKHKHPGQRQSFNQELAEATIQDAIADGLGIKGYGYRNYRKAIPVVYRILDESAKQYTVQEIYEEFVGNESRYGDPYKVSKEKFINDIVEQPIETVEL